MHFSFWIIISATLTAIISPIVINFMYKYKQVKQLKKIVIDQETGRSNDLFMKVDDTEKKNGTPNMGGILLLISVVILGYIEGSDTSIRLSTVFLFIGFWGFLDVFTTNLMTNNSKIKQLSETFEWRLGKLILTFLLTAVVLYIGLDIDLLRSNILSDFGYNINSGLLLLIFSIIGVFSIYAIEITDGLDGLMIGIVIVIYSFLAYFVIITDNLAYLPFISIVLGSSIVDLYYNIPPARFFNGGPSAMPLGLVAFIISANIYTIGEYFVLSSITWIILATSTIQILSFKFLHRRVFKIAPLHHNLIAYGWPHYKVTMRFWLYTIVSGFIAIAIFSIRSTW